MDDGEEEEDEGEEEGEEEEDSEKGISEEEDGLTDQYQRPVRGGSSVFRHSQRILQ